MKRVCTDYLAIGVGRACAEALARSGAYVGLIDFDADRQADTKASCEKFGVKAFAYGCDITDQSRVVAVFEQIRKDLGHVEYGIPRLESFIRR